MKLFLTIFFLIGVAYGSPRFSKEVDGQDLPLKLERHKRMFFIAGEENTKLQASFKFPIVYDTRFYFAYTETGFWRLFQETSSPIVDLNHNPEAFYRWVVEENTVIDIGGEHSSNGRDGDNSRSWNSLYIQPMGKIGEDLYLTSKFFYLWDIEPDDVYTYLGFMDFELGYKKLLSKSFKSNEVYVRWRPGSQLGFEGKRYDTFELGLKFKVSNWKTFGHLFINYYSGYVESQLTYDDYTNALRAGLVF